MYFTLINFTKPTCHSFGTSYCKNNDFSREEEDASNIFCVSSRDVNKIFFKKREKKGPQLGGRNTLLDILDENWNLYTCILVTIEPVM